MTTNLEELGIEALIRCKVTCLMSASIPLWSHIFRFWMVNFDGMNTSLKTERGENGQMLSPRSVPCER